MKLLKTTIIIFSIFISFVSSTSAQTFTVNLYPTSGDGWVVNQHVGSWDLTHNAQSGSGSFYASSNGEAIMIMSGVYLYKGHIYRAFMPVDTSSIPDNATILSASFLGKVGRNTGQAEENWLVLVQTNQANMYSLTNDDYDQCGAVHNPVEGSARISKAPYQVGDIIEIPLNATGLSWINKTGITKLGMRCGKDVIDLSVPNYVNYDTFSMYSSEDSDIEKRPFLKVTYYVNTGDYNQDGVVDARDLEDKMVDVFSETPDSEIPEAIAAIADWANEDWIPAMNCGN